MRMSFGIYKGEITFENDQVSFRDRIYRTERFLTLAFGISVVIFAVMTLLDFFSSSSSSEFTYIILAVLIIGGVPLIIDRCRLSFRTSLKYDEIEKVVIRENPLGIMIADFILKNKQKRHVVLDVNHACDFGGSTLPDLIKTLDELSLRTEIR